MAYNLKLAQRVEESVARRKNFTNRKMFGGVGFLLNGNMCVGVWKDWLILRVGEHEFDSIIKKKHTKLFDITGVAMKGWVMVHKDGAKTAPQLRKWIDQSVRFVKTLPKKP